MTKRGILKKVRAYVKDHFGSDTTGHDWHHIDRVARLARHIGAKEKADLYIVELGALLHDIGDWKFSGDSGVGSRKARVLLTELGAREEDIEHVAFIVEHISYKGGTNAVKMNTIEGKVVQDADRLDAIGAVGIARVFAYGGSMGRPIHDPSIRLRKSRTFAEYKTRKQTSINHFYEKLLLLKDRMNTKTGRALARQRHKFLRTYLDTFFSEWDFR